MLILIHVAITFDEATNDMMVERETDGTTHHTDTQRDFFGTIESQSTFIFHFVYFVIFFEIPVSDDEVNSVGFFVLAFEFVFLCVQKLHIYLLLSFD